MSRPATIMRSKPKAKREFSKIIFILVSTINITVILFTMYMIYITRDLSPLMYLIPAVATEMATVTGFYFSKAKAENKIKLMQKYGLKPDKDDINNMM